MNNNYALLNSYQDFTDTVAVYPKDKGLEYCALGLADEAAELFDKIVQYCNHLKISKQEEIVHEVGDVLWYAAQLMRHMPRLCAVLDVVDGQVVDLPSEPIGRSWTFADLDAIQCPASEHEATLMGAAGAVVIHAGFIAGRVKKFLRGDGELQVDKIAVALCSILNALNEIARFYKLNLALVSTLNRDKLSSRQERGALRGDGDKR